MLPKPHSLLPAAAITVLLPARRHVGHVLIMPNDLVSLVLPACHHMGHMGHVLIMPNDPAVSRVTRKSSCHRTRALSYPPAEGLPPSLAESIYAALCNKLANLENKI